MPAGRNGERSPVKVFAPMFFLVVSPAAGAELVLPQERAESGVQVGALSWSSLGIGATQMAVQAGSSAPSVRAHEASRVVSFGGAPLDGERRL